MRMRLRSIAAVAAAAAVFALGGAGTSVAAIRPDAPASAAASEPVTGGVVPTITVTAVGDICFASAPGRLIRAKGPTAPFAAVAGMLKSATVTVGNLECVLSKRGSRIPGKAFTFEGCPSAGAGLTYAGFDLLGLANNHSGDYGRTAMLDTIANLDAAGLAHAGAGKDRAAALAPPVIVRDGARIAFLSFCQIGPSSFAATTHGPGTAYTLAMSTVTSAIHAARAQADYVIVMFHWGVETKTTPSSRQVTFGRAAINAGADLVLSSHPHVIQGVEFYRGKLIAYSLGNFVFSPGTAAGHDTMALTIQMTQHRIVAVAARPFLIDGTGRPTTPRGSNLTRILGRIVTTSRGRGTVATSSRGVVTLRAR
jgi:poly-gamma-glutamate capsule biosynthesis protein CapA/YwtB (metallophosphatase superfamily)